MQRVSQGCPELPRIGSLSCFLIYQVSLQATTGPDLCLLKAHAVTGAFPGVVATPHPAVSLCVFSGLSPTTVGPARQEQPDFPRAPALTQAWHTVASIKRYRIESALSRARAPGAVESVAASLLSVCSLAFTHSSVTLSLFQGHVCNWMLWPLVPTIRASIFFRASLKVPLHVSPSTRHQLRASPPLGLVPSESSQQRI